MDKEFEAQTFSKNPPKFGFVGLKTPGFLGDHFARVESSGDQNLTMFILQFHVFSVSTLQSHENPGFPLPLQNLARCDHAQMMERKILCRIALTRALYDQIRPCFFKKYFSNFVTFDPASTAPKIHLQRA